ncbi:hypothetical protein F5Y16DRAFT_283331 [Xylariaceae sp. FL0255]|nr:hypothetical protein F5Y16DRAFT_283331 [Xylariaceae sp. FL0255]
MPIMASTIATQLGLGLGLDLLSGGRPWFLGGADWLPLQYLVPLISFVCVGLEGWCFFDLLRKTINGRRSAAALRRSSSSAARVDEDSDIIDYDGLKDFPRGGFEPSKNQLCIHGLLGIRMQGSAVSSSSASLLHTTTNSRVTPKSLTAPCGCQVITSVPKRKQQQRRLEMSYIAI